MPHSQEIENLFDADHGENIVENIEEIALEIEPVSEADFKFFEESKQWNWSKEIEYSIGTVTTDLFSNWLSNF